MSMDETKRVGLDVGTTTLVISSKEKVELVVLAPACIPDANELRRVERAMDRSKRATHPQHFNENGTIKRGVKLQWTFSKRYLKLKAKRKDLHRKIAVKRKQSHEQVANCILELGADVRVETMRIQALQKRAKKTTRHVKNGKINKKKRFGKTIANRAPAMLITIIDRKLGCQGKPVKKMEGIKLIQNKR